MAGLNTELDSSFFTYPLSGVADSTEDNVVQRRKDGVSAMEMLNYIFKKQFGIPNSKPYIKYNVDIPLKKSSINNSTKDKQYSQEIPYRPPNDLIQDLNFSKYGGERYISPSYPYIVYYKDLIMVSTDTINPSYYILDNGTILTEKAIPIFYGNDKDFNITYGRNTDDEENGVQLRIKDPSGNTLRFGDPNAGSWLFDVDTGIVTFYDDINEEEYTAISSANPPRISFWRYEGLIGNNSIMNVADF